MDKNPKPSRFTWLGGLRLRAFLLVVGIPLAAAGIIALSPAWATLPVVGVAVAAVMTSLSKVTQRLSENTCLTCGHDLSRESPATHGIICPECGSLYQRAVFDPPGELAAVDEESPTKGA